jgi:hypothetical protein
MGQNFIAKCQNCNKTFPIFIGGGFFFHLLHCDKCGRVKQIGFKQLGELHLRYLKGLPVPYCLASAGHDEYVRKNVPVEPITGVEYYQQVEKIVGRCWWCLGLGKFKINAPPRCPKCRSINIEKSVPGFLYD